MSVLKINMMPYPNNVLTDQSVCPPVSYTVGFILNPFMLSGLFYLESLDKSISNIRGVWLVFLLPRYTEIPVLIANSVDADQTPQNAASDLDLHCLPMYLL